MGNSELKTFNLDMQKLFSERKETEVNIPRLREGERREVTILFLDLKGFTSMSEQMDAEEVRFIIDDCFKLFTKDIERFGGYVDKYEGDCIMALFGAKKSSEFDVENAVRAALLMHAHLREFHQSLKGMDRKLEMRVGISTGSVVAGRVGNERPGDFTVYGDAVNLASRLESNAPVGGILVCENVYRQIRDNFQCQDKGIIQVKGRKSPVHVYTVECESQQGIERWQRSSLFQGAVYVDRDAEMEQIKRYLDSLASGGTGKAEICLLSGPPGIGKSRLLHQCLQKELEKDPNKFLIKTRCAAFESSYYAFVNLLRQGLEFVKSVEVLKDDQEALAHISKFASAEDRKVYTVHLPYLCHLLGIKALEESGLEPRELQLKFLMAIRYFSQALLNYADSRGNKFIFLFDDVQWMDSTSREALAFLLDQVVSPAIQGIFLISRDEYDYYQFLPSGLKYLSLRLTPLTESHSCQLIEQNIGKGVLPRELMDNILALGQGNPYFLEEILVCLEERNYLVNKDGRWEYTGTINQVPIPATLESLLLSRIDCLPKSLKEIVQIASVLGRSFDQTILSYILHRLGLESEELDHNLELLCRLSIFSRVSGGPHQFFFTQNLFQQVVYQSMLIHNRKIIHQLAAEGYQEKYPRAMELRAPLIAYHYLHSENPRQALKSLVKAVECLVRDFRCEEALNFVNQGLELLKNRELCEEEKEQEWRLLVEKEKISELLSDHESRRMVLENLLELAMKDNRSEKIALARNKISWYAINMGKYEQAINTAQETLQLPEIRDTLFHADACRYLGLGNYNLGRYDEAEKCLREALDLRRKLLDDLGEARDLSSLSTVLWRHGDYEEAINMLKRSLKIRQDRGDLRGIAHDQNNLGLTYWSLGDLETAKHNFQKALELYRQIGDHRNEGNALSNLSLVLYYQGNSKDAIQSAREALELSQKYDLFRLNINARIYLAKILLALEDKVFFPEIRTLLESAIYDSERTNYAQGIMEGKCTKVAFLMAELNLEPAYDLSLEALKLMQDMGLSDEEIYWNHSQICAQLDKKDESHQTLLRALEAIKERGKKIVDKELQKLYIYGNPFRKKIVEWGKRNKLIP